MRLYWRRARLVVLYPPRPSPGLRLLIWSDIDCSFWSSVTLLELRYCWRCTPGGMTYGIGVRWSSCSILTEVTLKFVVVLLGKGTYCPLESTLYVKARPWLR